MRTVSVVIPTYKNRGGLKASIDSVLKQDYKGLIEVIVVDDNQPDSESRKATEQLMLDYKDNSLVLYLKHKENKNGAAARNTGIKASHGDYIAFLDDDDLFLDCKLARQVSYLESHSEVNAVYCHARRKGNIMSNNILEGNGAREILLLNSNFYTPSLMFRREALFAINGFDETFRRHQDYELLLRFFKAGNSIGCIPEVLIEIGTNQGENILTGVKLENIKTYFFEKFDSFIIEEDKKTPGFRNKVYAKHYAGVFLSHVRHKYIVRAIKIWMQYSFLSPRIFWGVVFRSIQLHILGKA